MATKEATMILLEARLARIDAFMERIEKLLMKAEISAKVVEEPVEEPPEAPPSEEEEPPE